MSENCSSGCGCMQSESQNKSEVLCECHNVTKQDVIDAIESGVSSFEELQKLTAIGTDCPPCTESSKEYFQEQLLNKD